LGGALLVFFAGAIAIGVLATKLLLDLLH
jgi:hypothetical protein